MKKTAFKLGLVLMLALLACQVQARTDGQQAVAGVGESLRAKDCAGALKHLNAGLGAGYPEVALLAGTMFDAGICVEKNWKKAIDFYSTASAGGVREGTLRLVAGFAAAENGVDPAAALWWAKRAALDAGRCTANLPNTDDPDVFVEALQKWPASELAICNYVVGKISFMYAEARYPIWGVKREIAGRLEIDYRPADDHFRIDPGSATRPAVQAMSYAWGLSHHLARERYPQPSGIPPTWTVPFVVVFDTDKSTWW
jgi:hypothetical protein